MAPERIRGFFRIMNEAQKEAWKITLRYLKERQSELGLTNYRLAKEAGMQEPTIHRIMTGGRVPSVINLYLILAALKLNIHILPKEVDTMPYPSFGQPGQN